MTTVKRLCAADIMKERIKDLTNYRKYGMQTLFVSLGLTVVTSCFFICLFSVPNHEYCGPAGRDSVCDSEGAVPWP